MGRRARRPGIGALTGRGRRVGLVVNPTAGNGRAAAAGETARRRLHADGHHVHDLSAPDADGVRRRVTRALADDEVDVLVVVGGDGMVHLAVGLLAATDVPLVVVAAGTGNDNARELGLPLHDAGAAAGLVTAGSPRRVDLGRCTAGGEHRWFLGVLGAGFDSLVAERARRMRWPRGPRRYDLAVLLELPRFRAIPYAVTVDGIRSETEAMLVAVGNGPAFGGGMRVCPDARYDDGLLDVVVVHRLSTPRFLRLYPSVFRGTHVDRPEVQVLRGHRVELEATGIVAQADGERVLPLPLRVDVVPGALLVLVPPR